MTDQKLKEVVKDTLKDRIAELDMTIMQTVIWEASEEQRIKSIQAYRDELRATRDKLERKLNGDS